MNTDKKQALSVHLKAIRRMLIVSVASVAVLFVLFFYLLCGPLVDFVLAPVRARGIAAVIAGMPVIIWQVWVFVAPALYPQEKRLFAALFFVALLLFVGGVVFCYCLVFPMAIDLFWSAADGVASTLWSVKEYFNFVLSFVLPFGLMFELPVVVYMLARRGLVTYQKLAHSRKYVILVIAIIAAILTPPDAVSQCMLAIPMILLYEVAAQLARLVKPKKPAEA